MAKKVRRKIPQGVKVRSQLQREISSVCPFCNSTDVEYFEIHHIDGNPENNENLNLILICPTCHSKITKGDISQDDVRAIKIQLPNHLIEFVTVGIDSKKCSWTSYDGTPNAFQDHVSKKSPFPILNFSFINHTKQTALLTAIQLGTKHLYSGLSGIPRPCVLRSSVKYRIPLSGSEKYIIHSLEDQLEIPPEQAFKFQVELFERGPKDAIYEVYGRKVLYFVFIFGKYSIEVPNIFLNCRNENEKRKIVLLD